MALAKAWPLTSREVDSVEGTTMQHEGGRAIPACYRKPVTTVALFAAASSLMQQASLSIARESDVEADC